MADYSVASQKIAYTLGRGRAYVSSAVCSQPPPPSGQVLLGWLAGVMVVVAGAAVAVGRAWPFWAGCGLPKAVAICMSTVGGGCSSMCYGRSCAYCVQAGMSELV